MDLSDLVKYILEGIAVAIAAYFIPQKTTDIKDIIYIGLTAAATFLILDLFAPKIGTGARQGSGFGIGINQVGWQTGGGGSVGYYSPQSHTQSLRNLREKEAKRKLERAEYRRNRHKKGERIPWDPKNGPGNDPRYPPGWKMTQQ